MKNSDILVHTNHRPFPLPQGPWVMKQVWKDLLFAHWPVNEVELLPYLPPGLELEQWEGTPWISMSPFVMDLLKLRGLPPPPGVHRFLELNIRTYVVRDGKPGIFLLNLDASSLLAVAAARLLAHLPYRHATMSYHCAGGDIRYSSKRINPNGDEAVFQGIYRAVQPLCFHAMPGTLLHWLTERYCLYASDRAGRLYIGEIHHLPWPLQEAELHIEHNTSMKALGLTPEGEPSLLTFTKRLEVLLWPIKKIKE
ncbi:hypothetical protein GCM10010912_33700 [Paenibacillus albidus]|uniref:DUF2071 domain-containing protein n=1 Tax=Paenibacillus albidus TaxID=2041023 RepID=A0A917FK24_9BACL|nr:DUF2071 domain-containing protein [Paenibacillus albidus]GGF85661.1 hypothetical protein GCM10010912_33700 [Paenibacillus albidus]